MTNLRLTNNEQRIIDTLRRMYRESKGRPFQLTIAHTGGNAPLIVYRAIPLNGTTPEDLDSHPIGG